MSDFVVHTPEQLAAHDKDATERYLEALRELQAENARLRAHIQDMATKANKTFEVLGEPADDEDDSYREVCTAMQTLFTLMHRQHLAALGETK